MPKGFDSNEGAYKGCENPDPLSDGSVPKRILGERSNETSETSPDEYYQHAGDQFVSASVHATDSIRKFSDYDCGLRSYLNVGPGVGPRTTALMRSWPAHRRRSQRVDRLALCLALRPRPLRRDDARGTRRHKRCVRTLNCSHSRPEPRQPNDARDQRLVEPVPKCRLSRTNERRRPSCLNRLGLKRTLSGRKPHIRAG